MTEQELTEYAPSAHQKRVLEAFQAEEYACTVQDACKAANLSRQAYYQWFDEPEFCQWWRDQAERFFALRLSRVQSALFQAATKPCGPQAPKHNARAIQIFLQRFDRGFLPASKVVTEAEAKPRKLDEKIAARLRELLAGAKQDEGGAQ